MWRARMALASISMLLIAGGTVVLAPRPALAGGRGETILGDLNGDGLGDRAYLGVIQPDLCSVVVEYGQADGGFSNPRAYGYLKPGGTGLATRCPDLGVAVDLDGDRIENLVIGWFPGPPEDGHGNLLILDNDFTPNGSVPSATFQPSSLHLADFNGDGRMDVYSLTDQGEGFQSYLNAGDGTLARGPAEWCSGRQQNQIRDFNRDSAADALIAYPYGCSDLASGVVVVRSDGNVAHLQHDLMGQDHWTAAVVYADDDNIADVRTTSEVDGAITTFIGLGDGTFGRAPRANADSVTRTNDLRVIIDVLANDLGSREARVEIADPPPIGTVQVLSDRRIAYNPVPGDEQTVRFTYRLSEHGRRSVTSVHVRFAG
nr:FG-GAP-like repeat-containing protein [Micromonospora sp. DSM 115978]